MDETTEKNCPEGIALLLLGLFSFVVGPFASIPGIIISKRYRPFSQVSRIGYFLCWVSLVLLLTSIIFAVYRLTGR
jgi:hypothetical protein